MRFRLGSKIEHQTPDCPSPPYGCLSNQIEIRVTSGASPKLKQVLLPFEAYDERLNIKAVPLIIILLVGINHFCHLFMIPFDLSLVICLGLEWRLEDFHRKTLTINSYGFYISGYTRWIGWHECLYAARTMNRKHYEDGAIVYLPSNDETPLIRHSTFIRGVGETGTAGYQYIHMKTYSGEKMADHALALLTMVDPNNEKSPMDFDALVRNIFDRNECAFTYRGHAIFFATCILSSFCTFVICSSLHPLRWLMPIFNDNVYLLDLKNSVMTIDETLIETVGIGVLFCLVTCMIRFIIAYSQRKYIDMNFNKRLRVAARTLVITAFIGAIPLIFISRSINTSLHQTEVTKQLKTIEPFKERAAEADLLSGILIPYVGVYMGYLLSLIALGYTKSRIQT